MSTNTILIIVGEHSGDRLGADLINACQTSHPEWQFVAMGGQPMREAGAHMLVPNDDLAIVGFVEVIKHLKKLRAIFKKIKRFIKVEKPDLVILIDYPGFNLKIAKYAHQMGCKVLYYTSPQIWAWKAARLKRIQRDVDHMAVLFPFEEAIYRKADVPVTVVGHPMLKRFVHPIPQLQARQQLGLDANKAMLAILPGSRDSEISRLMPVIIETCRQLHKALPDVTMMIALAPTVKAPVLPDDLTSFVSIILDQTDQVVAASNVVICASGTATLEVALAEKPLAIIYKTSAITYALAKCFVKIPYIGLCNIVANRFVAKEFIQDDLTAEQLTEETLKLLTNHDYYHAMQQELAKTRHYLGHQHHTEKLIGVMEDLMAQ